MYLALLTNDLVTYYICRALQSQLSDFESVSKVGWLCPEQLSTTRILGNLAEVTEYSVTILTESRSSLESFVFAPSFEEYV